jgi:hypothetical protein
MRWFIRNDRRRMVEWLAASTLVLTAGWQFQISAEEKKPSALEALPAAVVRALKPEIKESTDNGEKVAEKVEAAAPAFPIAMRISSDVFVRRVNKDVQRVHKVDRMVLGTHAVGQSLTTGKYVVTLVPCQERALFLMSLTGQTVSKTTGAHDPVTIDTTTTTDFRARKLVAYDPVNGFYAGPTQIESKTHSVTDDVRTNRNFGRRIILRKAREQIEESRAEADNISRQFNEEVVREEFDKAIAEKMAKLNEEFDIKRIANLTHRECQVCSTDKHVVFHFGTGGALPELPEQTSKALIELCVHKSVLGQKLVGAVEKFDAFKDFLTLFNMPLRSPMPLKVTQPANWVPSFDNRSDWIAIDLGQQGFTHVAKK